VNALNQPPVAVIAGGNRSIPDTDGTAGELVSFVQHGKFGSGG
jgi:hypothetical protein